MEFAQVVRAFIVETFLLGNDGRLDSSQSLLKSGVVDSTGIMELVMFLEETYGVHIADEDMLPENLDSIDNIAGFLARKLAMTGPIQRASLE